MSSFGEVRVGRQDSVPFQTMIGYDFNGADNGMGQIKPGLGSIMSRHRGANNRATGLPNYVRMNNILGDGTSRAST